MNHSADAAQPTLDSPDRLRSRIDRLSGRYTEVQRQRQQAESELVECERFLAIADQVTSALEQLSNDLFQRELAVIETTLTKALQEVLEQPIRFRARASFRRDTANVDFLIERDGNEENILLGQGGSVVNVVSVGLRMFAVTTLDSSRHRRFLVLDEQDCWLRPDLVHRLVKIVQQAGQALGFQVLMISHHDVASFDRYADQIYQLEPDHGEGVTVNTVGSPTAAGHQAAQGIQRV
ncbi:MAG: DNA repair protein [Planctomycetota bacterium]